MSNQLVGMLLLGMAIGMYIPVLPDPVGQFQKYVGLVLIVLSVLLFMKA